MMSIFPNDFRRYFLYFFTITLFSIGSIPQAAAAQWVSIDGQVLFDGEPVCAMVLANGQNVFSCDGDGRYQLSVPLDNNGQITLFSFVSGFASFKRVLTVQEAQNYVVNMEREVDGRTLTVSANFLEAERDNWSAVSGTVEYNGNPVCAMILANGRYMFSCGEDLGKFYFETPKDKQGNITLFAFASGFQPYQETGSPTRSYPYTDNIEFSSQFIGEIFILNDESMWVITGVSDGYSTGTGSKDLTIYVSSDEVPDPPYGYGVRSDYFMLIEGNSTTFFVEELPSHTIVATDNIEFSSQFIGEIFILNDESMWVITGVSDGYSTGTGSKDLTIYVSSDEVPDPPYGYGVRSDYFMLIEGNSTTFFVKPL